MKPRCFFPRKIFRPAICALAALCMLGHNAQGSKTTSEELKELDKTIAGLENTLNDPRSGFDVTIAKCDLMQYYRQMHYWRWRREQVQGVLQLCKLRKQLLERQTQGQPVSPELTRRLESLQAKYSLVPDPKKAAAIQPSLDRIWTHFGKFQSPYGWHLVKLNLLRDLVGRSQRIRFYLQEAMRPVEGGYGNSPLEKTEARKRLSGLLVRGDANTYDLGPVAAIIGNSGINPDKYSFSIELDRLVFDTRRLAEEYGECFFGGLELSMFGQLDQAKLLEDRSEHIVMTLKELEDRREELTKKVLNFLHSFDKDSKFVSLAIPYRAKNVTLSPDGLPSELLFCTISGSGGGPSRDLEEPLCFDVVDYSFAPPFFKSAGEPNLVNRAQTLAEDVRRGYYVKQPVTILIHSDLTWLAGPDCLEKYKSDRDVFMRTEDGRCSTKMFNIWHPAVRALAEQNLSAYARQFKTLPHFLFYDKLTWEPYFVASDASDKGAALEAGYNPQAIDAFRVYLKGKFKDIAALNQAWRSGYAGFESITPPPDPFRVVRRRATPLSYEFESFRMQSYTDFLTLCVKAIQKEDPDHPVGVEVGTASSHFSAAVDSFRMISQIPARFIEDHYNQSLGSYTALNYLYSLCLYAGKYPIEHEYVWTYPRLFSPVTEDDFRITGELSIWRKMVWGRKVLDVFGTYDGWGYQHNYMDDRFCELVSLGPTGTILREAGTSIPMGKKRAREFWPYLKNTEIVTPKIAVLVPSTSMINEYPYHSLQQASSTINTDLIRLERLLTPLDYDFRFVPEDVVLSGRQNLSAFRAIILPYAPYFPKELSEKLLEWVRSGGTLICSGVPGIYDPYGFDDATLVRKVFGSGFKYTYRGDDENWRWELHLASDNLTSKVIAKEAGPPIAVKASFGQGEVLLSGEAFSATPHQRRLQTLFYDALERAIDFPTAASDHHRFELVAREDPQGRRFLFIVNPSPRELAVDYVTVDGEYDRVVDLGIGGHCRVPIAPRRPMTVNSRYFAPVYLTAGTNYISICSAPGRTTFQFQLAPGEGTVLELVRNPAGKDRD
ncbi:MAG: alpha-amylase family protein [Phycisphaerae bacterium]